MREEYGWAAMLIIAVLVSIYLFILLLKQKKRLSIADNRIQAFQKRFDVSKEPTIILSDANDIYYANPVMVEFFKLKRDFLIHKLSPMPQIKLKEDWQALDSIIKEHESKFKEESLSFYDVHLKFQYEEGIPIDLHIEKIPCEYSTNAWCSIITIQDLSKEFEQSQANHLHPITKMPTEMQALQDVPALYSKIHLNDSKVALVLLHIDNLNMLRAIVGYEQANKVLIKFTDYLKSIASNMEVETYHTIGNNFLLSIANIKSSLGVISLVEEIQQSVASLYKMNDVRVHLTMSAGITIYPDSGTSRNLLDNTYKALFEAQKSGEGRVHIYIPDEEKENYDEFSLHNEMYSAMKKNEFEVYYQPVYDAETKEMVSAEALVRWVHPEHGIITPDVFIPLMEKTGFIIELGHFVLEEVLKQQKRWELFKFNQIAISINIASIELKTEEFLENVKKQLDYHKVYPELIRFEITENDPMLNEGSMKEYITKLKRLGVGITLDDFGAGYNSFSYLQQFPGDLLKIDKALVNSIVTDVDKQRVVKAMVELGHTLGMKVLVEGIENKNMEDLLVSFGCDYLQGYYFSKPVPVFEFQKLLYVKEGI